MTNNSNSKKNAPDLEGLRNFAEHRDGTKTPSFFVGRERLIETFSIVMNYQIRNWQSGKEDIAMEGLWLFDGAPGVGKTALLQEFERLAVKLDQKRGKRGREAMKVVWIDDLSVLNDTTDGAKKEVVYALSPKYMKKFEKKLRKKGLCEEDGSVPLRYIDQVWRHLKYMASKKPAKYPVVVLMIENAQNMDDKKAGNTVSWLHQGLHEMPVIPIFAGTGSMHGRFLGHDIGISRIGSGRAHTLYRLSEKECEEAVQLFLDHFQVVATEDSSKSWKSLIAEKSEGWGQHLRLYLQALAKELHCAKGVLEDVSQEAVSANAKKERKRYYDKRFQSLSKPYLAAVGLSCLRSGEAETTGSEMSKVIGKEVKRAGDSNENFALPKGMDAYGFVHQVMRCDEGLLYREREHGFYIKSATPYFREYLVGKYLDQ